MRNWDNAGAGFFKTLPAIKAMQGKIPNFRFYQWLKCSLDAVKRFSGG